VLLGESVGFRHKTDSGL